MKKYIKNKLYELKAFYSKDKLHFREKISKILMFFAELLLALFVLMLFLIIFNSYKQHGLLHFKQGLPVIKQMLIEAAFLTPIILTMIYIVFITLKLFFPGKKVLGYFLLLLAALMPVIFYYAQSGHYYYYNIGLAYIISVLLMLFYTDDNSLLKRLVNFISNSKYITYIENNLITNYNEKAEKQPILPNKKYYRNSLLLSVLNSSNVLTKDILKNNNSFGGFCLDIYNELDKDPKQINKIFSNDFFMTCLKRIDTKNEHSFYNSLSIIIKEIGYKFENENINFYDNIKNFITYEKVKNRINNIKEVIEDIERDIRKNKK